LFAIYTFANPDFVTPVEGANVPNSESTDAAGAITYDQFTAVQASGPTHCAMTSELTGLVQCTPCYAPYESCITSDYTPQWITLFLVGFILNIIPVFVAIISYCGAKSMNISMLKASMCLSCVNCMGSLAWMICAITFRFSPQGFAISGTPVIGNITGMSLSEAADAMAESAISNFDSVTGEVVYLNGEMPSSGLFILVLCIFWFVGMGCAYTCCCIMAICFKDKFNEMSAAMKAQGGMK
jgi:hypothetical protein